MHTPPADGDVWTAIGPDPMPLTLALDWAVLPSCGAVVLFSGTARDHSEGRTGVTLLEYEAYDEQVLPRLDRIVQEVRRRWSDVGRIAVLHRTGPVAIGESSVVCVVSAPHRTEAFEAARYCIDTLKTTVPVWKREAWDGGESWAVDAQHITELDPS